MHIPTLVILAAVLTGLSCAVLCALWAFNRDLPGMRWWVMSYFSATAFAAGLFLQPYVPVPAAVVFTQGAVLAAAYLCFIGCREFVGRRIPPWPYAAALAVLSVSLSLVFTVVQPSLAMRFVVVSVLPGLLFLATARTIAIGGMRQFPSRYLFGALMLAHGVFLLARPVLFRLQGQGDGVTAESVMTSALSQAVVLESIMAIVGFAFGSLMLVSEHANTALRRLAEVDPLTEVFNRRAFMTLLDKAVSRAQRMSSGLHVLVLDLDHFKRINDTWGHRAGDDVLRHFVELARTCLRNEDLIARLGGEEFAIVLTDIEPTGAARVAQRLCDLVADRPVAHDRGVSAVTVSIGVATWVRDDSSETLLQRADAAMYRAKELGRNRVATGDREPLRSVA